MSGPIFHDPHGRRERVLRWLARAGAIVSTILGIALAVGLIIPPLVPRLALGSDQHPGTTPRFAGTRAARERIAARRRLFAALTHHPAPAAIRRTALPIRANGPQLARVNPPEHPIAAGFYVNWDDNSFSSLRLHAAQLDWVICEWGFLSPRGDSLRPRIDKRVLFLIDSALAKDQRPSIHLMLTNFDSARSSFDPQMLERFVTSPRNRARVITQLMDNVTRSGLAGVTVDLEDVPDPLQPYVLQFVRDLARQLHARGLVISQALPIETAPALLRQYAAIDDRIIFMLYDEHSGQQDSGPVASQSWYETNARRAARIVPPQKLILAVGAYGYDWNDAQPSAAGEEQTFQDVIRSAHQHEAAIAFDSVALNPYVTWTDADSTDHVVWFLDGVTAYNELLVARSIGAAGSAVWRLGAEDPSLWSVLHHNATAPRPDSLATVQAGYDVDFRGSGELLRIETQPTLGRRDIHVQPSGTIDRERVTVLPLPYTVQRSGNVPHRVALTFDDGPDSRWTPHILDTLRSRHAPATFFLIGKNIETNIALTRRIADEGHEVGNHSFTHPNLALTSTLVTKLELDATERIIEAVLDRRTAFFRPPYFGDAEPTTADELIPVGIASGLGYVTAGLHVDSDDWRTPPPDSIIANVLDGRRRALACSDSLHQHATITLERGCSGSVVLMHDGGGDRSRTIAALGPLIDSLRAEGDTLVLLSSLAGMTHADAMPPLPASSAAVRWGELLAFGAFGTVEATLYWLFLVAVLLGTARLMIILLLAAIQRLLSHMRRDEGPPYAPSVSVVVPAFREEKVIVKTIESLVQQEYGGTIEVVVVDDGSPDETYARAMEVFGNDPLVAIHRKANGGKASALNYGIARAHGEIIVGLDADTLFHSDTIACLVQPLRDPTVGAVAGNAKVGNRLNIVTRWQALEYVTSQNLDRRAFSLLDCITVVPGAVGAWRRELVERLGGFSDDTLAEDQDLTLNVRRAGYSIAYADDAVALTEAPDTLKGLANQRFRWSFGTLQCMWKHRDIFLRPKYGTLGLVAVPNVWLFQLLFPAVSPLADLLFLYSLFSVWLVRQQHGATYAAVNLRHILMYYGLFLLVDWIAAVAGFLMEPDEDRKLTWLVFLQRFVYRQLMYWVVVRSFRAAIRGHIVGWGKLERKATVDLVRGTAG